MHTILSALRQRFSVLSEHAQRADLWRLTVRPEQVVPLLTWLKQHTSFRSLTHMSAVDWLEQGEFQLTYLLTSASERLTLAITTRIARSPTDAARADAARADAARADAPGADAPGADAPGADASGADASGADASGADASGADKHAASAETIAPLWPQALTYEQEICEMYGIDFPGSPRAGVEFILEDWEHPPPMRRDFDTVAFTKEFFPEPRRDEPPNYVANRYEAKQESRHE